ncbi:MAG: hypothetical protein E7A72_08265 [Actinomyces urogenitalis]|uniref:hypothetical protein n=1 Tax=Actinomyces urogenitalis TaxID=103621 RepID=UPI00242D8846|nr:hypothetical protein [Actinomyces urogenitalis]MDU0972872.1 hypothetical protein [Actinomyces urogenitalis]
MPQMKSIYRPRHETPRRGVLTVVATAMGLSRERGQVMSVLDVLAPIEVEEMRDEA